MGRQGWVSGSRGRKKSKIFDFFKMSPKCLKSVWGCRKRDLVKFCCVFRSVDAFFCSFLVCRWALWGRGRYPLPPQHQSSGPVLDGVSGCEKFDFVYFSLKFPKRCKSVQECMKRDSVKCCSVFRLVGVFFLEILLGAGVWGRGR